MIEHLQTLFNDIMESGYYPTSWDQGLICSIYKWAKRVIETTTEVQPYKTVFPETFQYNLI